MGAQKQESKIEDVPPIVYKYLDTARTTYFDDEMLRVTQPGAQNDPFELMPRMDSVGLEKLKNKLVHRIAEKVIAAQPGNRSRTRRKVFYEMARQSADEGVNPRSWCRHLRDFANNQIGYFCTSRRWDSSLMWAHYADRHSGFCIGFNSQHEVFNRAGKEPRGTGYLKEVTYHKERQLVNPIDGRDSLEMAHTMKHEDWSYEEEFRMMKFLGLHDKKAGSKDGFDILLFRFPMSAVAEVLLGINASRELEKKIVDKFRNSAVSVWRCELDPSRYDVMRVGIR